MSTPYKALVVLAALFFSSVAGICGWLFVYTGDLPDTNRLSQFAPSAQSVASDPCFAATSVAIPSDRIGKQFQAALSSSEPTLSFADQIARTLMCNRKERLARYQLNYFRLSWHIRRRFLGQQLFTIYANRAYFGSGIIGVENASEFFFQKDATELSAQEAALLAALQRAPQYSPFTHPDSALTRRNAVLDAMAARGKLGVAETAKAKDTPVITFFSADERKFPLSVSPDVLKVLLQTKQAPWGLAFASHREVDNPAQLYRAVEVRLGSAEETDLIVLGIPPMSGPDNDWFWVVRSWRRDPKVILFVGGYSVELMSTTMNGYRDIRGSWSSPSETDETTYRFDGTKYKTFGKQDFSTIDHPGPN